MRPQSHHLLHGLIPTRDILDPDVSYSEPTSTRERAILAIWIILCICLGLGGFLFVVSIPASAAEINPSVDTIPFQCRFTYTKWLCDDSAGPAGAKGINGTPGTPGAGNFSAIYYNASNFTAYQNASYFYGNLTTGNMTINSNYTYITGAAFYNTTSINESYAYLPGRAGGQVLTGGTAANDDLILNGTSSTTKTTSIVNLQPTGGNVLIGNISSLQGLFQISKPNGPSLIGIDSLIGQESGFIFSDTYGTTPRWEVYQQRLVSEGRDRFSFYSYGLGTIVVSISSRGNLSVGTTSPTAQLDTTGSVRYRSMGAGTATFDAGGNITSVSDSKAKTDILPFTSALTAVKALEPKQYHYSPDSGLDTQNTYIGFIAQDVEKVIQGAVKTKQDVKYETVLKTKGATSDEDIYETIEVKTGTTTKSLDDRAIIAALVNALKEEDEKVTKLEARIKILEDKVKV